MRIKELTALQSAPHCLVKFRIEKISGVSGVYMWCFSDVPRTFPNNIYFQETTTTSTAQRDALFKVLVAVAHNNPDIGYCQVNYIDVVV